MGLTGVLHSLSLLTLQLTQVVERSRFLQCSSYLSNTQQLVIISLDISVICRVTFTGV